MSTDLFSLTKKIEKKLNANIKSQYLKSANDNVYYIAEFYGKNNNIIAIFACRLYIFNTSQGQIVAPDDDIALNFSNGNILTNFEIGEFVKEGWFE